MDVPTPSHAVAAFASFVRERLAEVGGTLVPLLARRDAVDVMPAEHDAEQVGAARHLALVIMGAAAPFATTSHARARLLRQAHASGLLSAQETEQVRGVLAIGGAPGRPRPEISAALGASG